MHHLLKQLGKDSVMFLAAKEFPLPIEYRFLPLEEVFHEAPADMADRAAIFLDCGNIDRMPVDFLTAEGVFTINIDHHHDNTLFGDVNLVEVDASCTAEIVYELAVLLGAQITPEMASALYVGLVTDTGKFMYENTNARTHRIAADLIEAGVQVDETYRRLYEHVPIEKLRLLSRALEGIQYHCEGRLVLAYITAADYGASGAGEEMTEGIIDHLRSVEGARVAALIRDLGDRGRAARKVSLRSSDGEVDVSAIARVHGGGGHKRAAGFSTDLELEALVTFLCGEVSAQLGS
jgi:phosphoesterase RecJ-like protein